MSGEEDSVNSITENLKIVDNKILERIFSGSREVFVNQILKIDKLGKGVTTKRSGEQEKNCFEKRLEFHKNMGCLKVS